eukprot:10658295-Karenia_brevis.AAC.1
MQNNSNLACRRLGIQKVNANKTYQLHWIGQIKVSWLSTSSRVMAVEHRLGFNTVGLRSKPCTGLLK